jgi:DtxR family transcriptional regulator, Mn-dependent transcriptional regulator
MVNAGGDRSPERARQDYCKAIYQLGGGEPVKSADVARRLGVSRASVSKLVRDLQRRGFVRDLGAGGLLQLTSRGTRLALDMVRRHRLVETFLHLALKVPLERVHADAEKIEHAISDDIARRLADFLGNPATDPHGHPIPSPRGANVKAKGMRLSDAGRGDTVVVTFLDDRDEAAVKYLRERGVLPGLRGRVEATSAAGIRLKVGRRSLIVARKAAGEVRCTAIRVKAAAHG